MKNLLTHLSIKNEDRDIILEFLLYFSRFEYAMKCCDEYWYTKDNVWSPNWKKLQEQISEDFIKEHKREVIQTLINDPPRKMTEKNKFESPPVSYWIIHSIKTVRNNLFHGGKYSNDALDSDRNMSLIKESLVVLKFIIESNEFNFVGSQRLRGSFNTF